MTCLELTVESPRGSTSRQILVDHVPFFLGRTLHNDLPLAYGSVSGRHLSIDEIGEQTIQVTDRNSTNGTFVDGRRLPPGQRVKLELPVRLRVGDVQLVVRAVGEGAYTAFTIAQSSTQLRQMVDEAVRQGTDTDDTRPFFEILSGPDTGRRFYLHPDETTASIGTDDSAQVVLQLSDFPSRIATISWGSARCWITPDAAGLQLGGTPVEDKRRLRSGDRMVVGAVELLYFDPLEQQLESLTPGVHGRTGGREPPAEDASHSTDSDGPPEHELAGDEGESGEQPRTSVHADTADKQRADDPDGAPVRQKPAERPQKNDFSAGSSATVVETVLLVMSLVFLVAALVVMALFFAI